MLGSNQQPSFVLATQRLPQDVTPGSNVPAFLLDALPVGANHPVILKMLMIVQGILGGG